MLRTACLEIGLSLDSGAEIVDTKIDVNVSSYPGLWQWYAMNTISMSLDITTAVGCELTERIQVAIIQVLGSYTRMQGSLCFLYPSICPTSCLTGLDMQPRSSQRSFTRSQSKLCKPYVIVTEDL